MDRDLLAWAVDLSTVIVGIAAAAAVLFSGWALRSERRRSESSWRQQIVLEHHARIYEAASSLIAAGVAFTRRVESLARTVGVPSEFNESDGDGTLHATHQLQEALDAYDRTHSALNHVYFLVPGGDDGQKLLNDLVLIGDALASVRPTPDHVAGVGNLDSVLDATGLRDDVEFLIGTDSLGMDDPFGRLRFVREILERYLRGRIGRFVPPPPLATVSSS